MRTHGGVEDETTPLRTDDAGYARGFQYHDGAFDGVQLTDGGATVRLALRTADDDPFDIVLTGVRALSVTNFRQGNIVLGIRVLRLKQARQDPEIEPLLAERLEGFSLRFESEDRIFYLDSAYGAEVLAVCSLASLSRPGCSGREELLRGAGEQER